MQGKVCRSEDSRGRGRLCQLRCGREACQRCHVGDHVAAEAASDQTKYCIAGCRCLCVVLLADCAVGHDPRTVSACKHRPHGLQALCG